MDTAASPPVSPPQPSPPARLASLDVYRGFVMLLMAAELLELPHVAARYKGNAFWDLVGGHTQHVAWTGCSLHDLIQPSFSFMVGVALAFSMAGRMAAGQSKGRLWLHALWRAVLLVLLGVFLRSMDAKMTYWTFEDTLSQIGLGYPILFALGFLRARWLWTALGVILAGYWAFFALHPLPEAGFDAAARGIPAGWAHDFQGFAAHWNMNTNAAWAADCWWMNLFPREAPFTGNEGGYSTLSFIPTLGTMILGLIAGRWLRASREAADGANLSLLLRLAAAAAVGLALGWGLDRMGVCPSVKKIWTPAWTLFSGGWCFALMAAFYLLVDVLPLRRLFFPLTVIGLNSLAMYVLVHTVAGFIAESFHIHFGADVFAKGGEWLGTFIDDMGDRAVDQQTWGPFLQGAAVLGVLWLVLFWMHRRRIYLRL